MNKLYELKGGYYDGKIIHLSEPVANTVKLPLISLPHSYYLIYKKQGTHYKYEGYEGTESTV